MIQVFQLKKKEEVLNCPKYHLSHFQWRCVIQPPTYAQIGYLPKEGFYVHMVCEERDPLRRQVAPQSQVCQDSAVEAFFTFPPQSSIQEGYVPEIKDMYFNFELNANGAMHAKYGYGRQNRTALQMEEYEMCKPSADVQETCWSADFMVPLSLIQKCCNISEFHQEDQFFVNFYKIAEDAAIEHYASYNPILSEKPNFHLPQYFAKAIVQTFL